MAHFQWRDGWGNEDWMGIAEIRRIRAAGHENDVGFCIRSVDPNLLKLQTNPQLFRHLHCVFGMSSLWIAWALIAFTGGIASHRLVFIHGELDNFSVVIVKAFISLWILVSVAIVIELNSLELGLVLGTILFLVFQIGLGSSIAVYRLYLHPLKHFPGEKLHYLTQWWAAFQQFKTERYFVALRQQHLMHGDFIRAG